MAAVFIQHYIILRDKETPNGKIKVKGKNCGRLKKVILKK